MPPHKGAVYAYAHITGDEWKPYEDQQPAGTVEQRSAAAGGRPC